MLMLNMILDIKNGWGKNYYSRIDQNFLAIEAFYLNNFIKNNKNMQNLYGPGRARSIDNIMP